MSRKFTVVITWTRLLTRYRTSLYSAHVPVLHSSDECAATDYNLLAEWLTSDIDVLVVTSEPAFKCGIWNILNEHRIGSSCQASVWWTRHWGLAPSIPNNNLDFLILQHVPGWSVWTNVHGVLSLKASETWPRLILLLCWCLSLLHRHLKIKAWLPTCFISDSHWYLRHQWQCLHFHTCQISRITIPTVSCLRTQS